MEVKVIARTFEVDNGKPIVESGELKNDLFNLGGRAAGVCYMPEDYFDSKIHNTDAAIKRANFNIGSGHHSPFDHGSITLQISGLPKIMAMILNSTEFYTTSEKSARYTKMKPETQLELDIYHKWTDIFKRLINDLGRNDISEKEAEKLAIENARYMISVFTPTHMVYTTTFRQISYMTYWFKELAKELENRPNGFNDRLKPYCIEIANKFDELTKGIIDDTKSGKFRFLVAQYGRSPIKPKDNFGDLYETTYLASFAELAQLQRHRTIHYEMYFSGDEPGEYGCYIPDIIKDTEYEDMWIDDFAKLAKYYPQCTLVNVLEQGSAHWFFVKCKERLCGRAQHEIMKQTTRTMQKFIDNKDKLSEDNQIELENCTNDNKVCTKCMFKDFKCKEPCRWGAKEGLNRII